MRLLGLLLVHSFAFPLASASIKLLINKSNKNTSGQSWSRCWKFDIWSRPLVLTLAWGELKPQERENYNGFEVATTLWLHWSVYKLGITHAHACAGTHIHTHTHTNTHIHTCACAHTHTHAYTHAYTHTHIHTYKHTHVPSFPQLSTKAGSSSEACAWHNRVVVLSWPQDIVSHCQILVWVMVVFKPWKKECKEGSERVKQKQCIVFNLGSMKTAKEYKKWQQQC